MSRKSGTDSVVSVLLDSTYLLPAFGVEAKGVDDGVLPGLYD